MSGTGAPACSCASRMPPPPDRKRSAERRKKCHRGKKSACTSARICLDTGARRWPVRLSVRTPGFQPGKRGSIPLRAATSSHHAPPYPQETGPIPHCSGKYGNPRRAMRLPISEAAPRPAEAARSRRWCGARDMAHLAGAARPRHTGESSRPSWLPPGLVLSDQLPDRLGPAECQRSLRLLHFMVCPEPRQPIVEERAPFLFPSPPYLILPRKKCRIFGTAIHQRPGAIRGHFPKAPYLPAGFFLHSGKAFQSGKLFFQNQPRNTLQIPELPHFPRNPAHPGTFRPDFRRIRSAKRIAAATAL